MEDTLRQGGDIDAISRDLKSLQEQGIVINTSALSKQQKDREEIKEAIKYGKAAMFIGRSMVDSNEDEAEAQTQ